MTKKFYKGKSDIVFKSIFLKEENRDILEKLIEEAIYNIPISVDI